MNKYIELKNKREKEINNFPMFFAFNMEQMNEGMKKLGLEPEEKDKLSQIGYGGYIKKEDIKNWNDMYEKHIKEYADALLDDQFVYDAMLYELANHEYIITGDASDALSAVRLEMSDVNNDERLSKIFKEAKKQYFNDCEQ